MLFCGAGVGYSLHKEFVNKLPKVADTIVNSDTIYSIEDSIEGISTAVNVLMSAIFSNGVIPIFDFGQIRPKGSLIAGQFLAPGPEPTIEAFNKVIEVAKNACGRQMTTLEIHRIICLWAKSVVSGGVRRSALIALFDKDDKLMLQCKTSKDWYITNPELAMANNSILCTFGEPISYNEYKDILEYVKKFGEPGFIKVPNYYFTLNPCVEVVMNPVINGKTGFAFCNLVEINGSLIKDVDTFFRICDLASFVATIQALYTDFKFLGEITKEIAERDRAIGVSITCLMDNDMLQGKILEEGASVVVNTNKYWAKKLNINPSKRCTVVKPSGNATSIIRGYCSGVHPVHDSIYLRRLETSDISPDWLALKDTPLATKVGDRYLISYPINYKGNGILKVGYHPVEHLKYIGMVKHFWINKGTNTEVDGTNIPNNVSCTVEVDTNEWDEIAALLYANSHLYTGVSLLPRYNEYPYLPFTRLSDTKTIKEYLDISEYISKNDINLRDIFSKKLPTEVGDNVAIACSGGACEIK